MNRDPLADRLERHGVKPTANRLMIVRALAEHRRPLSMGELEAALETVDKSVISRTLSLLRDKRLVHVLEDDGVRYELCRSHDEEHDDDMHVHFHCLSCGRTFCLESVPVPSVPVPEGYKAVTANFVVKGFCPGCSSRS